MRLFVALNLPRDVRASAWAATEPLRAAVPSGVAWVREESLHVTLRFLGERPDTLVDELAARLSRPLAGSSPPEIELATVGAFPSLRRPRVLWIGGPTNSALTELYQEVDRACSALGVPSEERAFRLHVTVGRVRHGGRLDVEALAHAASAVRFRAAFTASTVDVMESELDPAGSRYRVAVAVQIGPRG